jgi:Tfp pilus assembly protein PilF
MKGGHESMKKKSGPSKAVRYAGSMLVIVGIAVSGGAFLGCSSLQKAVYNFTHRDAAPAPRNAGQGEVSRFGTGVRPPRGNPDSHYRLGGFFQERGRHKEALEEFEKAITIDPGYLKAYGAMGISYDFLLDHSRASASYNRVLAANPHDHAMLNNLGYSFYLQGKYPAAIEAFTEAIDLNPVVRKYHSNLGRAIFETGDHEGALAEYRLAFDEAGAQFFLAHFLYEKGLYKKAQRHYARALVANPSFRTAKKGLKAALRMARIQGPPKVEQETVVKNSVPPAEATRPETRAEEKPMPEVESVSAVASTNSEGGHDKAVYPKKPDPVIAMPPPTADALSPGKPPGKALPAEEQVAATPPPAADALSPEKPPEEALPADRGVAAAPVTPEPVPRSVGPEDLVLARCHVTEKDGKMVTTLEFSRAASLQRQLGIELSNGSGEGKILASVTNYLKSKGYRGVCEADDKAGDCDVTQILYREEYLQPAYRVAQQMPGYQEMKKIRRFSNPNVKVRVLIGKDMLRHSRVFSDG